MADQFMYDQIAIVEAQITKLTTTMASISDTGVSTYTFGDSQTSETVTRKDEAKLNTIYMRLLNTRNTLRKNCGLDTGGDTQAVPSW